LRAAEVDYLIPTHKDVPTDQQQEVVIVGGWCAMKKLQRLHRLAGVGLDSHHVPYGFSCQASRHTELVFKLHDL